MASSCTKWNDNRMKNEKLVEIKGLVAGYGDKKIFDDTDFYISNGEIVGLLGESGSGKSTLCYILCKMKKAYANTLSLRYDSPGFIMQNPQTALDPIKNIYYTLVESKKCHLKKYKKKAYTKKQMYEEMSNYFRKVNLQPERLYDYPYQFSGGELQRISLVLALIKKSNFIIFDEATSMLDCLVQAKIINMILELKKEYNLTYLFVSHDIDLIKLISDRFYILKDGKLLCSERQVII